MFEEECIPLRYNYYIMDKNVLRLKVVLVEKGITAKALAQQLGTDPSRISKWCTGFATPSVETLVKTANCLNVDIKDLFNSTLQD